MSRTLLIVDDHAGFRSLARALLEAEGYLVIGEAVDGASGVAAAHALTPDVVLLDVALPDLDGFLVCERIMQDGNPPPAVILTSSRDISPYRERLQRSKAVGFVAKNDLSGAALEALAG
ncbi:MAG: hypothetical protein QOH84_2296 [Kribbellaceae bacterium]|jgi:DNA-binding NarL/FixJ family response regulator|nr:hypothetical protein [Kribbellaceae bacterium]